MDDIQHHKGFPPLTIEHVHELAATSEKSPGATSRERISLTGC